VSGSSADLRRSRALADAAAWALRMNAGALTDAEQGKFVDWLRESPVHVAEMLRMGRLESALSNFDWRLVAPMVESHGGADFIARSREGDDRRARARRGAWLSGIAATLLIVCTAVLWLRWNADVMVVHTQSGERREITLADGSVVQLSPNTDLHIRLTARVRSVLIDRGESLFRVAKNPARPFVVSTPEARVQAVGTVFSVARNTDAVVVTVTEGQVRVSSAQSPESSKPSATFSDISLRANEQVSVSTHGTAGSIRRIANSQSRDVDLAENRWVFEDARVADVVARFNGANRLQIRVADPSLLQRTVSGVFKPDDPKSFLDFLQAIAGASLGYHGEEVIVTPAGPGAGGGLPIQ